MLLALIAVILEQLLDGLLSGVFVVLIALGLSLIFALGGIVNMAHGALYAIGAYLAVVLARHTGFAAAFLAVPVVAALLGLAIERAVFRREGRREGVPPLLLTFALALVAEQALGLIFGASPLPSPTPGVLPGELQLGGISYPKDRLVVLAIALVAITLTALLLYRTPFGRVVRAGAQNPEMVGALGIALAPYRMALAALGVALAGLAGALSASIVAIGPAMGQDVLTAAFVVVTIGGIDSFAGLVAAALAVGLVHGLTAAFEPAASEAAIFILMALALLLRPRGLLGARDGKRA
ncbi:MAG TPA: branched-chain amino acid ABC transporter permease [Xanthobacteraceae bacterium]|nr:branched-chain amino acid ABC transporter permease [Xanthobacteraceae bacterium]